jgi:hypothetical protein
MISVLIVTYNAAQTIRECLLSLNRQTFRDFEVILVDNNSTDETLHIIESIANVLNFPLKSVSLTENPGFTGGNNVAFKYISQNSSFIVLLNPDAYAEDMWLKKLVEEMENHIELGACASKILTYDGKSIDAAGDMLMSSLKGYKREATDPGLYPASEYVFGACAAAAIYRKSAIDEIGFFDEDFFLQCDDTDLSFRLQLAGWKVLYVPDAIVYHKVSHAIGRKSDVGVYYSQRNMEFLRIKNVPLSLLIMYLPQMMIGYIVEFSYFGIRHMKWKLFLKAKIDALKLFPAMLRKRKHIIKKVDNKYIRSLITPLFSDRSFMLQKLRKFRM